MIHNGLSPLLFLAFINLTPERLVGMIVLFPLIALSLTVHEFWHAYSADLMGDPTGRYQGRCTLNPLAHLDPIGTILMFIGPIGWARPVPINSLNFANPTRGMVISVAAGPLSNLGLAIISGIILRVLTVTGAMPGLEPPNYLTWLYASLGTFMTMNVMLFLFNLIPLYPLDGHHLFREMLQGEAKRRYIESQQFGIFILVLLVLFGGSILDRLIMQPGHRIIHLIAGDHAVSMFRLSRHVLSHFFGN